MSDTRIIDQDSIRKVYRQDASSDGHLAVAIGIIAILIGICAAGAGIWIAYDQAGALLPLPGGMPAAEAQTISIYLVACGALTFLLGGFSIYKAQDM
jgi:hypothetical protein